MTPIRPEYMHINYNTDSKGEMSTIIEDIDSLFRVSQCSNDSQIIDSYINDSSEHRASSFGMTDDTKVIVMWSCLKELFCGCFKCKCSVNVINNVFQGTMKTVYLR